MLLKQGEVPMTANPQNQNGKAVMQQDEWDDGSLNVNADDFVSQLDAATPVAVEAEDEGHDDYDDDLRAEPTAEDFIDQLDAATPVSDEVRPIEAIAPDDTLPMDEIIDDTSAYDDVADPAEIDPLPLDTTSDESLSAAPVSIADDMEDTVMTDLSSVMQPANGTDDGPIMSDLSSVMEPIADDTTEAIMTDLSSVMEPIADDTSEAIMTDLSSVMEPIADDTSEAIMTDLSSVMEPVGTVADTGDRDSATMPDATINYSDTVAETPTYAAQASAEEPVIGDAPKPISEPAISEPIVVDLPETGGRSVGVPEYTGDGNLDDANYAHYYGDDVEPEEAISDEAVEDLNDSLERDVREMGRRNDDGDIEPLPYMEGDAPVPYVSPASALSKKFRHYIETRWYPQWQYY
ncbi:MAG: hypothetical protein AAF125_17640, partial [Chloroflexota bacterium]